VINKYSNCDKQVLNKHTIVIIAINSGNSIDMRYLWVIVINNSDTQVGLYSGGLIFGWAYIRGGGAYSWNEVSVSTCGGLIHGGLILGGGGLIFGGLRYTFYSIALFVFSINRIRQNASHTDLLVYLGII
jgi:hypothetical protein